MQLTEFLTEWNSTRAVVRLRTSGSTGKPKEMLVEKKRMEASARMTCDFLGLTSQDKALLCMPLDYIAGKMMVVRSLVCGMSLLIVEPSRHPLANLKEVPTFVAMTPMQVRNTLETPDEMSLFCQIRNVIIGGSAIDASLEQRLRLCPNAVWSTYGMTETLSHVALRRVSGDNATLWYTPLSGVTLSQTSEGTLCIDAPKLHDGLLSTNDIVEMNAAGQFRFLGRKDNVINSGGVKIQIEEVETRLLEAISMRYAVTEQSFMITASPDTIFGEAVTLLLPISLDEAMKSVILGSLDTLPRYWRPKRILDVPSLPRTTNGKLDRATAKLMAVSYSIT